VKLRAKDPGSGFDDSESVNIKTVIGWFRRLGKPWSMDQVGQLFAMNWVKAG
jgi:hypothetical protein